MLDGDWVVRRPTVWPCDGTLEEWSFHVVYLPAGVFFFFYYFFFLSWNHASLQRGHLIEKMWHRPFPSRLLRPPPTPTPGFIRLFKASAARRRSGPHSPHQMALWGLCRNDPIFLTITVLNYRCLLRKCHYGGYHFGKKSGFPSSFLNGSSWQSYFFSNESWAVSDDS